MEVVYNGIVDQELILVPLKRGVECIGIDNEDKDNQTGYMDRSVICQ